MLNNPTFDTIGLHMVFAYSKMGKVIALNVETINPFCLPHLVEVSALKVKHLFCFRDGDVYML